MYDSFLGRRVKNMQITATFKRKQSRLDPPARAIRIDMHKNKYKYLLVLPVVIYLLLFCYKPMYGIIIAFKDFRASRGISGSNWVGFKHFIRAINDDYFWRAFGNTLKISFSSLLFSFPVPVALALLINEVRNERVKRVVQTVTYMPHFIAIVIVCGIIKTFCQSGGVFNDIIAVFGGERTDLLADPKWFYPIYIISDIWQHAGWDSIIYLAALSAIDQEQYEAASIDGASRFQQLLHISLPGLLPTVSMLLILRLGQILSVGYEKILLLYQPLTYEVADVLSTYVYRKGIIDADYSFSTAINQFNSVVNLIFLVLANRMSKKSGQSGLF